MSFIVIEGADGSGKTSVAGILREKLNATLIKTSMTPFLPSLRKYVDAHPGNVMARFVYFLSLNKYTADNCMGAKDSTTIFDRYAYSTFVAHLALDEIQTSGENSKQITEIFDEEIKTLQLPDTVIFLYVDPKVREQRLGSRKEQQDHYDMNKSSTNRKQELFQELANRLKAEKKQRVIEVDTTNHTIEQVAAEILKQLDQRK